MYKSGKEREVKESIQCLSQEKYSLATKQSLGTRTNPDAFAITMRLVLAYKVPKKKNDPST